MRYRFVAVGAEFVILGAITTSRCRSAVSVAIATLGLSGNEEAKAAAKIVFADLGRPLTTPGESEMTVSS